MVEIVACWIGFFPSTWGGRAASRMNWGPTGCVHCGSAVFMKWLVKRRKLGIAMLGCLLYRSWELTGLAITNRYMKCHNYCSKEILRTT